MRTIRSFAAAMIVAGLILGASGGAVHVKAAPVSNWDSVVAAARREGQVTVYSVFSDTIETQLFRTFTEQTGIRVNYVRVGGSEPTVRKFLTEVEANQWIADVLQVWSSAAYPLRDRGLAARLNVPNGELALDQFRNRDGFLQPTLVNTNPIVYNGEVTRASDLPREYKDLTDPKYRGRFAMGTPENSANVIEYILAWAELYGWDWIRQYARQQVLETTREVEAADFIARGERPFGVLSQTAPAAQILRGAPITYHWVRPIVAGHYVAMVPSRAPRPNAARVFANFLLSPQFQQQASSVLLAYAVLPRIEPPKGFPPLTAQRVYQPNQDVVVRDRGKIIEQYRRIMQSGGR